MQHRHLNIASVGWPGDDTLGVLVDRFAGPVPIFSTLEQRVIGQCLRLDWSPPHLWGWCELDDDADLVSRAARAAAIVEWSTLELDDPPPPTLVAVLVSSHRFGFAGAALRACEQREPVDGYSIPVEAVP